MAARAAGGGGGEFDLPKHTGIEWTDSLWLLQVREQGVPR